LNPGSFAASVAFAEAERADPARRLSPIEEILTERLGRPRKVEVEGG
jgi:hypothetical protein